MYNWISILQLDSEELHLVKQALHSNSRKGFYSNFKSIIQVPCVLNQDMIRPPSFETQYKKFPNYMEMNCNAVQ